ncbi:MAG: hypothetical protein RIM99_03275 [Cyclobacteriaceae bacterium]
MQHLSIDIVLGAVILLRFFSKLLEVTVEWPVYVLLASAVWSVYTIDHIRDSVSTKKSGRDRYLFHKQYARPLKITIILVVMFSSICIFYIPESVLISGLVLTSLCLLYILFQSRLAQLGLKELYVATMYSLGILLAPFSIAESFDIYMFLVLLTLAFLNLTIFSWFEIQQDEQDSFSSIAIILGKGKTEMLILSVCALGLALGISGLVFVFNLSIFFLLMTGLFSFLTLKKEWSSKMERYRTVGDAVFILPIFFELF